MFTAAGAMIYLMRHPDPAMEAGICYGRLDVPLAKSSTAEIKLAVSSLPPMHAIYSSPSRRCRTLAEAVGRRNRVPVRTDPRLHELDFGAWEGRRWDELPRAEFDVWASHIWEVAPGAGESLRSLWARIDSFRRMVLESATRNGRSATLIVSHQGPLRVLWAQANNLAPAWIFSDRFAYGIAGLRSIDACGV